jgi:hypothetical protein
MRAGRGQIWDLIHQQLLKPATKGYNAHERGSRGVTMKTFTVATVILALVAGPAFAQGKRGPATQENKPDEAGKKAADKAYKAALERIPEPKEKYDPWGVARPAEPAKNPK